MNVPVYRHKIFVCEKVSYVLTFIFIILSAGGKIRAKFIVYCENIVQTNYIAMSYNK